MWLLSDLQVSEKWLEAIDFSHPEDPGQTHSMVRSHQRADFVTVSFVATRPIGLLNAQKHFDDL